MKTIILLASIVMFTYGCDTTSDLPKEEKATNVLIFIRDASQSVQMNSEERTQLEKWLKRYFLETLEPNTDVLLMSVNANSNSVANHQFFKWQYDQRQSAGEYQSETDKLMEESMREGNDQTQKINLMVSLLKTLKKDNIANAKRSQIIEMVPEILRLIKGKGYTSQYIIFYSDMIQEGERSFITTPLLSKSVAETYAKEDALGLKKEFDLPASGLQNVKSIQILLPKSNNPKMTQNIQYYYATFFDELNYQFDLEWHNLK